MADGVGAASHADHDLVALAASVGPGGRPAIPGPHAVPQAGCRQCEDVLIDLRALVSALPYTTTPLRPRSYPISDADARRLRASGLRDWWRRIGTARDSLTRPLALGFTSLGVAGLLVAAAPLAGPSGAGTSTPVAIEGTGTASDDRTMAYGTDSEAVDRYAARATPRPGGAGEPLTPFTVLSWSFLATGGGLFVVRRIAPRWAVR